MLNNFIAVGTVENFSRPQKNASGDVFAMLTIKVTRPFKNGNGEYDSDFFKIILQDTLAEQCTNYLTENATVGVKCRVQNSSVANNFFHEIIAEKISILSM